MIGTGILLAIKSIASPLIYAPTIDEVMISKRYATREGAELMKGTIIESLAINISVQDLEPGELWTRRGYEPEE